MSETKNTELVPASIPSVLNKSLTRRSFLKGFGKSATVVAAAKFFQSPPTAEAQTLTTSAEIPPLPEFSEVEKSQHLLVVPVKEQGATLPATPEQIQASLKKTADFFRQSSYGKFNLTYELMPWMETTHLLDPTAPNSIGQLIDNQIMHASYQDGALVGRNLNQEFQSRLYLVTAKHPEGVHGHGSRKKPYHQAWVYLNQADDLNISSTEHEIGHTLGLEHIRSLKCAEAGDFTNNCSVLGLSSDSLMAERSQPDLDIAGVQKLQLGWITPKQVYTVRDNIDQLELTPYEIGGEGKKMLRIFKPDTQEFYYIDFSAPLNPAWPQFLNFYLWDEKTKQINKFQGTEHYWSEDGDEFYDRINNIRVRQLKHTDQTVYLSVKIK